MVIKIDRSNVVGDRGSDKHSHKGEGVLGREGAGDEVPAAGPAPGPTARPTAGPTARPAAEARTGSTARPTIGPTTGSWEGRKEARREDGSSDKATPFHYCAGCGVTDVGAPGSLLLFDDPDETSKKEEEIRYCSRCMLGKNVRVFWPVDSQWYVASVEQFDRKTGEHLLRYPDGDTEWVRIGESHTNPPPEAAAAIGAREESGSNVSGVGSFALSALGTRSMSHGEFGLAAEHAENDPEPPHSRHRSQSYERLTIDRTTSSMSSFGLFGGSGTANPPSAQPNHPFHPDRTKRERETTQRPQYHVLSPYANLSFSSKNDDAPSSDAALSRAYPGPADSNRPPSRSARAGRPPPLPFSTRSESWERHHLKPSHRPYHPREPPPSDKHERPPYQYDQQYKLRRDIQRQQREERSGNSHLASPGKRDGPTRTASNEEPAPHHHQPSPGSHYPMHPPPYSGYPPPNTPQGHQMRPPPWAPPQSYGSAPPPYFHANMFPHPPPQDDASRKAPPAVAVKFGTTADRAKPPSITQTPVPLDSNPISRDDSPHHVPPTPGSTGNKNKKAPTKAWTKEEDDLLLEMVLSMKPPLKWSIIAQALTDRTGKQCRERYVNHLNPRLKSCEWSPIEDATIYRLFTTCGTQWAKMSKVIPGRTDNGIKNRFHNLRRQLDRDEETRLRSPEPKNYSIKVRVDAIRDFPKALQGPTDKLWDIKRGLGIIAANTVGEGTEYFEPTNNAASQGTYKFGPFEKVKEPIQCVRCGLFAPSVQCGSLICSKTKWCKTCTLTPSHVGGNLLRECLNLRKSQNPELVVKIDIMMKDILKDNIPQAV